MESLILQVWKLTFCGPSQTRSFVRVQRGQIARTLKPTNKANIELVSKFWGMLITNVPTQVFVVSGCLSSLPELFSSVPTICLSFSRADGRKASDCKKIVCWKAVTTAIREKHRAIKSAAATTQTEDATYVEAKSCATVAETTEPWNLIRCACFICTRDLQRGRHRNCLKLDFVSKAPHTVRDLLSHAEVHNSYFAMGL